MATANFGLNFETSNQSIFGTNTFNFLDDGFIGRDFNESISESLSIPFLGSVGFDASAEGQLGIQNTFELEGGTVDAVIPINLFLTIPDGPFQAGDTFMIESGFSLGNADNTPSFTTSSPNTAYNLDLIFDVAASLDVDPGTLLDFEFDIDQTENLVNFDSADSSDIFFNANLNNLNVSIPNINTSGTLTSADQLTSSGSDQFISGSLDYDSLVTNLFGIPLQGSVSLLGAELNYNLLDAEAISDVSLVQAFSLSNITLPAELILEDGTIIPFNVGSDIEITVPSNVGSSLDIEAVIDIDALFSNQTDLTVDAELDILAGEFELNAFGFSNSFGPLFEENFDPDAATIEVFDDTFNLDGFNQEQISFQIDVIDQPVPPNDDIIGTPAADRLRGTDDDNRIFGLDGDDRMRGRDGDDILFGGPGNDRMRGDNGNDTLVGGLGNDVLSGNDGSDTFVLAVGEGTDIIRDFELSEGDQIGLTGGLQLGQLTFNNDQILLGNEILAEVNGIDTSSLTSSNFVTVTI